MQHSKSGISSPIIGCRQYRMLRVIKDFKNVIYQENDYRGGDTKAVTHAYC